MNFEKLLKLFDRNKFLRKIANKIISSAVSYKGAVIVSYRGNNRSNVMNLINQIKKENKLYIMENEAYQIFMAVKATAKIKGDIAEIGSYKGGSAKLISEAKGDKSLHLFDNFEGGLPSPGYFDEKGQFSKGDYSASFEKVKDYLKKYNNVYFYKGIFPFTASPIKNKTFSFVHLDLDLYESTKEAIKFFYPRMNKGGIIISHDYIHAKGVRKAFDDFFRDKPEPIIEMSGSQCLIVKVN
ncbi:MAG TPA: TylF/MycF/NovP-related O-methyltransferase [Candidatus Nanoarchaeia archaeon]|nr:TylF/MycF/NovP-related O-methyltransferase [Candidatus Nanoarchaeia archaeon]